MSIHVTCSSCQFQFAVADEFAGRPGRCPECQAIIEVPLADLPSTRWRSVPGSVVSDRLEQFDDRPTDGRRRGDPREMDEAWSDDRSDRFDDRSAQPERSFDPAARAARWSAVSRGLRNVMIAVVLATFNQAVESIFVFVEGVEPGQQDRLTPRDIALAIGTTTIFAIGLILWAVGRVGCGRVPYLPARSVAFPAGIIAGLTALCGVSGLILVGSGMAMAQNNLAAGFGLVLLGFCALFPTFIGFIIAEVMALVSQVRMADGLRDDGFARASRVQMTLAIVLGGISLLALCGVMMFAVGEMQEKQRKQLQQAQLNQDDGAGQGPGVNPPPPPARRPGRAKPAPPPGPNPNQPPPPEFDPGEYPNLVYGATVFRLVVFMIYALATVWCVQLGRAAIQREVARLEGTRTDDD